MERAGMRTAAVAAAAVGLATSVAGAEYKLSLRPLPRGLDVAEFELWIPDTIPPSQPVRGVLGSSNYHAGAQVYDGAPWREFAARAGLASLRYLLASGGKPIDTSREAALAVLRALKELAPLAGRPELEYACFIPTGISWAANQVCRFVQFVPDRVIAAVAFRATEADIRAAAATPASRQVPLLHLGAGCEHFGGYRPSESAKAFESLPKQWAPHANLLQAGEPHHTLGDPAFTILWLESIVELRLPRAMPARGPCQLRPVVEHAGWSGTYEIALSVAGEPWKGGQAMTSAAVRPYLRVQGGVMRPPEIRAWLPSERVARAWVELANTGRMGAGDCAAR